MPEARSVRNKVIVRILGHPLVLAPFLAGATIGAGDVAFGGPPGIALFALIAGTLLAAGAFVTRLVADDGRTARRIWSELEANEQKARQAAIDDLDQRLTVADRDPRPETALRDLRALIAALDEIIRQDQGPESVVILEIEAKARQIFEQTLRSLEQTLRLGETAQRLLSPAARAPILAERERVIGDIEAGARQLGGTVAALQRLASGGSSQSELARLRDDLDQSLELAATVDARLQALLHDPGLEPRAVPQPPTLEQKG